MWRRNTNEKHLHNVFQIETDHQHNSWLQYLASHTLQDYDIDDHPYFPTYEKFSINEWLKATHLDIQYSKLSTHQAVQCNPQHYDNNIIPPFNRNAILQQYFINNLTNYRYNIRTNISALDLPIPTTKIIIIHDTTQPVTKGT